MDKVLVTGGSGFIALHCIDQLLGKGYAVRTTIRSESRIDEIKKAMNQYPNIDQNLEFHICDLLEDSGWEEAVHGCDYVLHVASPFTRVIVDPSSSSPDAFASLKASSAPSTIGGTSDSRGPVKLIIIPTFISSAWAVPKPNVTRASTDIKILNILFSL